MEAGLASRHVDMMVLLLRHGARPGGSDAFDALKKARDTRRVLEAARRRSGLDADAVALLPALGGQSFGGSSA
jgi:hypothetical protein